MYQNNPSPATGRPRFGFLQWLWALSTVLRFWDRRFRTPYSDLPEADAHLLRQFHGEPKEEPPPEDHVTEETPEESPPKTGDRRLDCGHKECAEIAHRLREIARTHSYADYERALFSLGYCTPQHEDEVDCDPPIDALDWIDPETMPHTMRWWKQKSKEIAQKEEWREMDVEWARERKQWAELQREMREDEERDRMDELLERWQAIAKETGRRPLTEAEWAEVADCEEAFGGPEPFRKLVTGYGWSGPFTAQRT